MQGKISNLISLASEFALVVQHVLSMYKAMGSISSTRKNTKVENMYILFKDSFI